MASPKSSPYSGKRKMKDRMATLREKRSKLSESVVEEVASSPGGSEVAEDEFDAQSVFDEFIVSFQHEDRKILSVLLMANFMKRQRMGKVAAATEAASVIGFNEKNVRRFYDEFHQNKGNLQTSARGKHAKKSRHIDDELIKRKMREFAQENCYQKGSPNMTAQKFQDYVNDELLPSVTIPAGLAPGISHKTACNYLHELGFSVKDAKKGVYIDGHEREDVVSARQTFLERLERLSALHEPPPLPSDDLERDDPQHDHLCEVASRISAPITKKLVLIFHDESAFNANDDERTMWVEEGKTVLRPKSKGSGIMVSDFIDEHNGYLRLTDEEFQGAQAECHDVVQEARVLLEYGENRDGWWKSPKFMRQVENAVKIASIKYPPASHTVIFLFDQSSNHCAYAEDALNVLRMNVGPGGAQPKMRDTLYQGEMQKLVDSDGLPKGMKRVLEERGVDTSGMVKEDMISALGSHYDFKEEKPLVQHFLESKGLQSLFIPKFHCELNPIEYCWGKAKQYTRAYCNYSITGLRKHVRPALDSVSLDTIRKYFRKIRDYMQVYREGVEVANAHQAVQKMKLHRYKSHRRAPLFSV